MIKKIIFDLDNTLMMFDEKYITYYQTVLEANGELFSFEEAYAIFKAVGQYEKCETIWDKQKLLDFVNKQLNRSYSMTLLEQMLDSIGENWTNPVSDELINTLEYLSSKYELYVLSNMFTNCQIKRLEKVGISHYFKEIIGTDKIPMKPAPEAFLYFVEGNKNDECVMIGDSIYYDIDEALSIGMRAILFDYKDIYKDTNYNRVVKIGELMDIL